MIRERIDFTADDGEIRSFFVEEETRVAGVPYLLVSDSEEDEATAYILKDLSGDGEETASYVIVEDEAELDAIARIFEQMMEEKLER